MKRTKYLWIILVAVLSCFVLLFFVLGSLGKENGPAPTGGEDTPTGTTTLATTDRDVVATDPTNDLPTQETEATEDRLPDSTQSTTDGIVNGGSAGSETDQTKPTEDSGTIPTEAPPPTDTTQPGEEPTDPPIVDVGPASTSPYDNEDNWVDGPIPGG